MSVRYRTQRFWPIPPPDGGFHGCLRHVLIIDPPAALKRVILYDRLSVMLCELDAHPIASVALLRILFQTVAALNYALAMSG